MKKTGKPLVPDLNFSSAYYFKDIKELKKYHKNKFINTRYSRDLNLSTLELENYFSSLCNGYKTLCFSSGMSSIGATLSSLISKNSIIITFGNFYRKSRSLIEQLKIKSDVNTINFLDYKKFIEWSLKNSKNKKKLIFFLEIPSNPFLKVIDISDIRKRFKNSTIIVDLSFSGIKNDKNILRISDVLIFSLTKYINGHNDVLGGAVVIKSKKNYSKIWDYRSTFGGVLDTFSSYLTLRSLKTYDLRIKKMLLNTRYILNELNNFKNIKKIWYPGEYENQGQKLRFSKYLKHGGSVITFETNITNSSSLFKKMKTIKMAPSFGSIDTLIEWPYYMSYFSQPEAKLKKMNITKNLIRLAIGCEDPNKLIKDLQIFNK